jgi:hypothetical protein
MQTLFTIPKRSISAAVIVEPVNMSSMACECQRGYIV